MKLIKISTLLVLTVVLLSLTYINKTKLPVEGKVKIKNLDHSVQVYRDSFGIPHIEAQNYKDGFKTLGYIFASQRLFQMEMLKRIVRGSLSEIYGPEFIEADTLLRTFGFNRRAKMMVEKQKNSTSKDTYLKINSFVEGVNEYVENNTSPIEFILLGVKPTKFEVTDLMGVGGYMALTFAEAMLSDLTYLDLKNKLPKEQLATLKSRDQIDWKLFKNKVSSGASDQILRAIESIHKVVPLFYGSNSWVLGPSRTKSGFPILANDPHIAYSNPHIFIEAHLKIKDFELYGHFIPLTPMPILGHTKDTAWALTMSETDDLDFYMEKINPENPDEVMYKNKWTPLQKFEEVINVKGADPVTITVLESPHGPIIDSTKYGLNGYSLAIKWSALDLDNNNFETFSSLPYAKTVNEFKTALSKSTSPGLNISWVSKSGDIAWWVMNKIPKRPAGFIADEPMPGWNGKFEYEGYLSIDENPHQVNPKNGVIVSANYKPQVKGFEHIAGYWQPAGRYFRIAELLAEKEVWSVQELQAIQNDNVVPTGSNFNPIYIEQIDSTKLRASGVKALDYLKKWDGQSDMQNVATSIYHMTTGFLIQDIFRDELNERYNTFAKGGDFWSAFKTVMNDLDNSFWDNVNTKDVVETPSELISNAFNKAIDELEARLGRNIDSWQWGKLHLVEFVHPFGKKRPLDLIFNIGPYPASGGRYQVNNVAHDKSGTNFTAVHGPATRRLIDMADTSISQGIIPTGNSGNIFDTHFNDQTALYLQGKYRSQIMDWNLIKKMPKVIFY